MRLKKSVETWVLMSPISPKIKPEPCIAVRFFFCWCDHSLQHCVVFFVGCLLCLWVTRRRLWSGLLRWRADLWVDDVVARPTHKVAPLLQGKIHNREMPHHQTAGVDQWYETKGFRSTNCLVENHNAGSEIAKYVDGINDNPRNHESPSSETRNGTSTV